MGILSDLVYYAPYLTPSRAMSLFLAKARKRRAKDRLRSQFQKEEPVSRFLERLGLDADHDQRLCYLKDALAPLGDLLPAPELRRDKPGEAAGDAPHPEWTGPALKVLDGIQTLFGQEVQVGWPPRWGWRWDDTALAETFSKDVRSTWEIQRLQGLLPLAQAAEQNSGLDREDFSKAYIEGLLDFHREHPGPSGVAWTSALELGLRLISLGQGLPLVVNSDAFARHHMSLLVILDRHARWLAADLSLDKVIRGNHLLGELAGLLVAGHLVPSARDTWWGPHRVPAILENEILDQIHPDGVSVEQSLTYEKFILEFLLEAACLAHTRNTPFSPQVRERLRASAVHLEAVTAPDGSLPRVGDCDSGRGTGGGDDPHRTRELTGRVKSKIAPGTNKLTPPTVFTEHKDLAIASFPAGGHVTVRSAKGDFLFVRGGPFGHGSSAHSHADWLSPVLYLKGEAVLIDPGVFGYGVEASGRNAFRDWPAHNVLYLEPNPGPTPAGRFRWKGVGDPASLDIRFPDDGVEVQGAVAWGRGEQALLWHRSIRYNQLSDFWLIRDRTSKNIQGPVCWAFHFAPEVLLEETGQGQFLMTTPAGKKYKVTLDPAGTSSLDTAWVAPAYGVRCEGLVIRRRVDSPPEDSELRISPIPRS